MTHLRKTIRDSVATLVTGLATTGARVYKSRNLPLTTAEFPCLCVYARSDTPDYDQAAFSGGKAYPVRTVDVHIQGYVKDSDAKTIENTLDLIAEEVETVLFSGDGILGGSIGTNLGSQTISLDDAGDETLGTIDMSFDVLYRIIEGVPGTLA